MRSLVKTALLLWGLSFAFHLIFALGFSFKYFLWTDTTGYEDLALKLMAGEPFIHVFDVDVSPLPQETVPHGVQRTIGYPGFLALMYSTLGQHLWPVFLVQMGLGSFVPFLMYLILAPLTTPKWAFRVGVFTAFFPSAVAWNFQPLSDGIFLTLFTTALWAVFWAGRQQKPTCWLLPGLLTGLALAFRPTAVVLPIALGLTHFKQIKALAVFAAGFLVLALPQVWFHGKQFDHYALTPPGGPMAVWVSAEHTRFSPYSREDAAVFREQTAVRLRKLDYTQVGPALKQMNQIYKEETIKLAQKDMGKFVRLHLISWPALVWRPPGLGVIKNNANGLFNYVLTPLDWLCYVPCFLLSLWAMVHIVRCKDRTLWFFMLCIWGVWAMHMVVESAVRYHLPTLGLHILLAGWVWHKHVAHGPKTVT